MLACYFDEAGGKDYGFTVVAGWLGPAEKWERFEWNWKLFLAKYDVPYFHMAEFSQSAGAYVKWRGKEHEGTRRRFLQDALVILDETVEKGFTCYVNHDVFENTNCYYQFSDKFRNPYAFAARICVEVASLWAHQSSLDPTNMKFIFEGGGPGKGGVAAAMSSVLPTLSVPSFEPSSDIAPCPQWPSGRSGIIQLQAADWLAYEVRKFVADHDMIMAGSRKFRASLGMLPKEKVIMKFFDFQRTAEFCRDKNIPKRERGIANPSGIQSPINVTCPKCNEAVVTANADSVLKINWGRTFQHESCGFNGPWVWNSPRHMAAEANRQKPPST